MFKENRLIYKETPSVTRIISDVEGEKFPELFSRFRQLYGEKAGFEKGRAMLKRVEEHCYKVEKAFKGESPDKLANMIRKGAIQEFELEKQIIMSELKHRAKDVAKAATKAPKVPVAHKLPVAPMNATVYHAPDGKVYAWGKNFPMQEVQDPMAAAKPKLAAAKPAIAKAVSKTHERFAKLEPSAAKVKAAEKAANAARSEAELMKLIQAGNNVPAEDFVRLGWRIKTGIQNGKVITVLTKGAQFLGGAGRALRVVGSVVGKAAIPIQCLIIGWDIYVGYKCLKGEVRLIRQKRMREGKNPNAPISAADLIHHVATNPDRERAAQHKQAVELDTKAYEIASKKLTFLGKAHEACVYAKGVLHDVAYGPSKISKHNMSGWDFLNPGSYGEALATSDANNQMKHKIADEYRNGAARCRALAGQLTRMLHTLPHTRNVVIDALKSTASHADNAARYMERDAKGVRQSVTDGVAAKIDIARQLVEADRKIVRQEKKKHQPKHKPKSKPLVS